MRGKRSLAPAAAFASGLLLLLGTATTASAAGTPAPPFRQCPAVGRDAGCGTLIVVGGEGRLEALNDPRTGPFGDGDDILIGVQNDSEAPVKSIRITSDELFHFDGDGVCSGTHAPAPEGCPFGQTGYEGPGVEIEVNPLERRLGTIEFTGEGLAAGASTYLSLEGITLEGFSELTCGPEDGHEGCHPLEPMTLALTLSGEGDTREKLTVSHEATVTGQATLAGPSAASAGGTVEYEVFSDAGCTHAVASAAVTVSSGTVPASSGVTLAPGTYYWRATYSGDALHAGYQTPCGPVIEFVVPECSAAGGAGHFGPRGSSTASERNRLATSGSPAVFVISEPGVHVHLQALTSSSCVHYREFTGAGPAKVNGVGGYLMSFAIDVTEAGIFLTAKVEKEGTIALELDGEKMRKSSIELFS